MRIVRGLAMAALGVTAAAAAGAPFAGRWRIAAVRGADAVNSSMTRFELAADGSLSTTVGCNQMAGKPTVDGDRVSFWAMATTQMGCAPPLDRLESTYAAALDAVRSWRIEGTKLLLIGGDGETEVTLERAK